MPKSTQQAGMSGDSRDPMARRELVAQACAALKITTFMERLPRRAGLLVFNYHRIGHPSECPFARGVFSATAKQFDEQLRYLKRQFHVATLEEVLWQVD